MTGIITTMKRIKQEKNPHAKHTVETIIAKLRK